jgi:hypothetical protein
MDFIERIFGMSPDGGSSLFEWLLLVIPFVFIAIPYLHRRRHTQCYTKSSGNR